jgi:cyclophilin family peptidyl-prolyl cis-trans isomerase/HEAT repeat protein
MAGNRQLTTNTMRLLPFLPLLIGILLFKTACTPPDPNQKSVAQGKVNLDLRNKRIQKLYDLRDRHATDSLLRFLSDPDVTLRYLAAISFASLRDSVAVEALAPLLADPVEDVRIAAAFALGQIGSPRCEAHLIRGFEAKDSLSQHQRFNAVVLEAVGKCGGPASLKNIASVTTYLPTDTLLLEGQCRAIYRYGVRGITDPAATAQMVNYVANERIPARARLMAAHYLARTKDLTLDSAQTVQISVGFVRASSEPDIRMALARALGKSPTTPAFGMLSKVIRTEQDWRVKCNLINALAKYEYDTARALVTPLLGDANPHVSRTAAEFFVANGQARDGDWYWRLTRVNQNLPPLSQIALFRASNKFLSGKTEPESKDFVNYRLKEVFQQSKNAYERAACLGALAESGWNYRWIHDRGFADAQAAVKTAAAEALLSIGQRPDFYAYFGEGAKGVRRELYTYLREAVASGDAGLIAAMSDGFSVKTLNYKTLRDSARLDDLKNSLTKLKMPRDVEAYMALDRAIAYFEERPQPAKPNIPFSHPIDWERLGVVTQTTEALIETAKGKITLELYPEWAPGSVANFLELAATGFFNGKNFHRVVSNFVVQGGCPRGDGYGALDYTIRSEIGLAWYDAAGYLGMASAGPDTEGTQFFITHSPTPHLDGNYTIFGKVKSGMDVVDALQMGDVMEKVTVKY